MSILSPTYRRSGWWIEVNSLVETMIAKDGLLVAFWLKDVREVMDQHYPHILRNNEKVWYFNETLDREIAEQDGLLVIANPQVLWELFFIKRET